MFEKDPLRTLFVTFGIVELAAVLVFIAVAVWRPRIGAGVAQSIWRGLGALAARRRTSIALVAAVNLLLSIGLAAVHWPTPRIQDEFSYILAADTFSHGRLANPPEPMWRHFETEHVLQQPTYASKYPPAHGLVLALGQTLTGHPLVGTWIGTALMCAAVCWMLQAWLPARWALIGGLLTAVHPAILGWWGHGYWGGQVAMLGGALLYGALRRIIARPRALDALLMGAGLALLANSRPYEGFMASLPAAAALGLHLVGPRRPALPVVAGRIVLPLVLVLGPAAAMMARYNDAVTGEVLRLPYQHHASQYNVTPMFLFQEPPPEPAYSDRKLRDFHVGWEQGLYRKQRTAAQIAGATAQKVFFLWGFFFGPALTVGLAGLLVRRCRRAGFDRRSAGGDRWLAFAVGTCVWSLGASLICVWFNPHYLAPVGSLLLLLPIEGFRRLRTAGPRRAAIGRAGAAAFLIAIPVVFISAAAIYQPDDWWSVRRRMMDGLAARGGKHLIILRHGRECLPHQEWVYNGADPENEPVIWARELDSRSTRALVERFKDRTPWLFMAYRPEGGFPELVPYTSAPAWMDSPSVDAGAAGPLAAAVTPGHDSEIESDLDGDGRAERLVINQDKDTVTILREQPDGQWSGHDEPVGTWPIAAAIADFDRDGHPDIAVACRGGHGLTFLRGRGDLAFDAPAEVTIGTETWYVEKCTGLAAADLDGDGTPDLVLGTPAGSRVILSGRATPKAAPDAAAPPG